MLIAPKFCPSVVNAHHSASSWRDTCALLQKAGEGRSEQVRVSAIKSTIVHPWVVIGPARTPATSARRLPVWKCIIAVLIIWLALSLLSFLLERLLWLAFVTFALFVATRPGWVKRKAKAWRDVSFEGEIAITYA